MTSERGPWAAGKKTGPNPTDRGKPGSKHHLLTEANGTPLIGPVLHPFATLFTSPTWRKAQLLLVGAILTPGQRTVAAALRVMGLSDGMVMLLRR